MAHSKIRSSRLLAALLAVVIAAGAGLSPAGPAQAGFERAAARSLSAGLLLAASVRVIRKTTIYVTTLPKGCVRTEIGDTVVWRCGKTYYEPDGNRYVVVYVE